MPIWKIKIMISLVNDKITINRSYFKKRRLGMFLSILVGTLSVFIATAFSLLPAPWDIYIFIPFIILIVIFGVSMFNYSNKITSELASLIGANLYWNEGFGKFLDTFDCMYRHAKVKIDDEPYAIHLTLLNKETNVYRITLTPLTE